MRKRIEEPSQEAEVMRQQMFRWRDRFLVFALPPWLALNWMGFPPGTRVPALVAHLALLVCAMLAWRALYRFARANGTVRYAMGQLLLAIFLTPLLFAGIWAVPSLVSSDIELGVARQRAEEAAPSWLLALDTLVAFALLSLGVALVGFMGIVGLFLAAVAVPLLYKGFRVVTDGARP